MAETIEEIIERVSTHLCKRGNFGGPVDDDSGLRVWICCCPCLHKVMVFVDPLDGRIGVWVQGEITPRVPIAVDLAHLDATLRGLRV